MNNRNRVLSSVILAAAIVALGFQIKPNQTSSTNFQGISVVGEGKSSIAPDTLEINLSIIETAKTTALAQKQNDEKIAQVQKLFEEFGIDAKDINTTNASINPEYDRTKSPQELNGYRASQNLHIELRGQGFEQRGANILAKISEIGGITIDNTTFTLKDQAKATQDARSKAFTDAQSKAEQLAKLAGVKLGKAISITDQQIQSYPRPMYNMKESSAMDMGGDTSPLSAGETEVIMNVSVSYEIK